MARPSAEVSLPSRVATVMLVMDVSGSMRASDVNPTRIAAAETAAKRQSELAAEMAAALS